MGRLIDRARELRPVIEVAAQSLSDEQALYAPELFEEWDPNGHEYAAGHRVRYDGVLYSVLQAHTSQPSWRPSAAPSLFARVLIPDPEEIPEWIQPDSTNAYSKHDIVRHNGRTWESLIDHNVWEPGAVGTEALWRDITETGQDENQEETGSGADQEQTGETGGTEGQDETTGGGSGDPEPDGQTSDAPAQPDQGETGNESNGEAGTGGDPEDNTEETTSGEPDPDTQSAEGDQPDEWVQPTGAHDAYQIGDIVMYNGTKYICTSNNNVYAPGVFGWDEVTI